MQLLKLDKRIHSVDDIFTPFTDTDISRRYEGTKGYFAQDFEAFADLNKCYYGTLDCVVGSENDPYIYSPRNDVFYKFFLADEFVRNVNYSTS